MAASLVYLLFFAIVVPRATSEVPNPDPAPLQLLPLPSSAAGGSVTTIPAFPEQTDATTDAACPLDLSGGPLLSDVRHSCSASAGGRLFPPRSRCCPALAAWLFSAYSATALAAAAFDLPLLPEDAEACAAGAEAALRSQGAGVVPALVNGTCDTAYCYCGVRLRRLRCPGGAFTASATEGRWVPTATAARVLEKECARPGLTGCTRCLRSLNQLTSKIGASNTTKSTKEKEGVIHDNQCQFMGLTWLLTKNQTAYMSTATAVLREFMTSPDGAPTICKLTHDDMPMAVDSAQLDGLNASLAVRSSSLLISMFYLLLSLLVYYFS